MGFAKKEKKKIKYLYVSSSRLYIPTSKKDRERNKESYIHTQSSSNSKTKKIFKITSFENVADSFPKYKKEKSLPLPLKYVSQRTSQLRVTNHRVPILFDPSSPPDLRAPLYLTFIALLSRLHIGRAHNT